MNDLQASGYAAIGEVVTREAGQLLMEKRRTGFVVSRKGTIDLVTEADLAAEALIVGRLKRSFPGHSILAEEGHAGTEPDRFRWVIDPLDGTTNYAHGFPFYAVSIALEVDGDLTWGAVYDPFRDEMFTAERGKGSRLNGQSIRVSDAGRLEDSLLATGFPYDIRTSSDNNLRDFHAFALRCRGVRRGGSAALDFAYVAAGRLDGYWEAKLRPWDCAAGYLLVREAGGRVTDYNGREGAIFDGQMVASNGRIHQEMLAVLEESRGNRAPGNSAAESGEQQPG